MAEKDILVMGRYAKPYLDEQRAKARPLVRRIPMPLRERESVRHLTRPRRRRPAAALA